MSNPVRRFLVSIIPTLLVLYAGWAVLLVLMQRGMMFPGTRIAALDAMDERLNTSVEQVWLPFSGGSAEAWFLPAADSGAAPVVIVAHGNAELIDFGMQDAEGFHGLGLSVLLVEYPGYGRSEGRPSRRTIAETFKAGHDWLMTRSDVDPERIVGFGRSLGSGAITDLARERVLHSMVLVSPFSSVATFAKRYLLPPFLARDRFDNAAVLREFDGPVLLIHGRRDTIIPHAHSERLLRASGSAELVSLECGHNDCPPDWDAYLAELRRFFVRAGVLSS